MAAVKFHVVPCFYTRISKKYLSVSTNTQKDYNVNKKDCINRHDDTMCFLHDCRYHIVLIGDIKELLQNWMHSVSSTNTWTVCITFSSSNSVAKMLPRLDKSLIIWRGRFNSTTKLEKWTECPPLRKKDTQREI